MAVNCFIDAILVEYVEMRLDFHMRGSFVVYHFFLSVSIIFRCLRSKGLIVAANSTRASGRIGLSAFQLERSVNIPLYIDIVY